MTLTRFRTSHTFELTPRQVQVLRLIEEGRTNFEIAQELGVSLDGAKYHVREIIGKLGVSSREEAVAVWRAQSRQPLFRRLGWFAASTTAVRVAAAAAGLVIAAGAAAGIIIWAVGGGDDGEPATPEPTETTTPAGSPTATTSATPSATPSTTPEVIAGVEVKPLTVGDPVPLPDDVALYIESGCTGCDGPAAALQRVYRGPDGEIRTDDLFRLPGATLSQPEVDGKYITSMAFEGGRDILLALCESPYCGGVGNIAEGAKVSIHHSADGGITWANEMTLDGGVWIRANLGGGPGGSGFGLIHRIYRPSPGADYAFELVYYPTLDNQPINLQGQDPNSAVILEPANGPHLLLGADGISLYRLEGGPTTPPQARFGSLPAGSTVVDLQFVSNGLVVTWLSAEGVLYSARAEQTNPGEPEATLTEIFRWPDQPRFFSHRPQGAFVSETAWIVSITNWQNNIPGNIPAVVDLETATIRPIREFHQRAAENDRLLVKAVDIGPFARVANTDGDCLNVREAPSLSAASFGCYAEGVLLRELGERQDADGTTWAYVFTPDQRSGWASTEFLETSGSAPTLNAHPAGTRTGIAAVDVIIAALEESQDVPQDLVRWGQVECAVTPSGGIPQPPQCPEGVADGTPIDVISGAACEGYYKPRPTDGSPVRIVAGPEDRLYAVARMPGGSEYPPGAEYVIVYASGEQPGWARSVYVADGKIVADWGGCGTSPAEHLARGGDVVFPPPD